MAKFRGKLDKISLAFRERQRQQSRAQFTPVSRKRKEPEKTIPVKPFDGIPQLQPINLADYSDLVHAVNRVVSPGKNLEQAVACIMINMLLSLPDNIYQPGKSYSKTERQYTREQLRVFRDALSAADVSFDSFDMRCHNGAGRFEHGIIYRAPRGLRDLRGLIENDYWIMEGRTFDIVYVNNLSKIVPKEGSFDAEEIAEAIAGGRYEKRLEEISAYFEGIGEEELKKVEEVLKAQGVVLDKNATNEETAIRAIRQCLEGNPQIPARQKEILTKMIEGIYLKEQAEREIQEEMKRLPDEKSIAASLSKNLNPKGILILGSSEATEIACLRLVDSYDSVSLYQKQD